MRVLAEQGLVDAICGGACSCATCHVYVDAADLMRLAPADDVERALLEGLINTRPGSRLSCQIRLGDAHDGMRIEVAKTG